MGDFSKKSKRRNNVLYKLTKKGVVFNEEEREIMIPYGSASDVIESVRRLRRRYRFNVQFYIG